MLSDVSADPTWGSNAFQALAAATGKARSPSVERLVGGTGSLKTRDLTSRDLFQCSSKMLTTSLCLLQRVLYKLPIELKFLVLFLSVLVIPTCGRLSWPALWSKFGRIIK